MAIDGTSQNLLGFPGFPGGNIGNQNWFPPFFPPIIRNQAILVVRVGANFFQVLVFDGVAQAITITAAQAAILQQLGFPSVTLT